MEKIRIIKSLPLICAVVLSMCGCGDREVLELMTEQEQSAIVESQGELEESSVEDMTDVTVGTADESASEFKEITEKSEPLCVYICGAVENPGVYEMPQGSRLYELVNRAGGLSSGAAADYINQADCLVDAQRVYIPTESEVQDGVAAKKAAGIEVSQSTVVDTSGSGAAGSGGKVNINTADVAELQSINGIGASRAADIVAYREANGAFGSIEDIMKVSGIKEGLFAKIKDSITVR